MPPRYIYTMACSRSADDRAPTPVPSPSLSSSGFGLCSTWASSEQGGLSLTAGSQRRRCSTTSAPNVSSRSTPPCGTSYFFFRGFRAYMFGFLPLPTLTQLRELLGFYFSGFHSILLLFLLFPSLSRGVESGVIRRSLPFSHHDCRRKQCML